MCRLLNLSLAKEDTDLVLVFHKGSDALEAGHEGRRTQHRLFGNHMQGFKSSGTCFWAVAGAGDEQGHCFPTLTRWNELPALTYRHQDLQKD